MNKEELKQLEEVVNLLEKSVKENEKLKFKIVSLNNEIEILKIYKRCIFCGTHKNLTKHHLKGIKKNGENKYQVYVCRKHHDDIEMIKRAIEIMERNKKVSIVEFRKIVDSLKKGEMLEQL
jgi:rubrerythrin